MTPPKLRWHVMPLTRTATFLGLMAVVAGTCAGCHARPAPPPPAAPSRPAPAAMSPRELTDHYLALADEDRWAEALPVIEEILRRGPGVSTSWFNQGVCLTGLGRHGEAATSFLAAHRLNPADDGAQYRAFRSLRDAGDYQRFLRFAEAESRKDPHVLDALHEYFPEVMDRPEFARLSDKRD